MKILASTIATLQERAALRTELADLLRGWDLRLAQGPAGTRVHLLATLTGRPVIERIRQRRANQSKR